MHKCTHILLCMWIKAFSGVSYLLPTSGFRDWIQVSLGDRHFYPMSHLNSPVSLGE